MSNKPTGFWSRIKYTLFSPEAAAIRKQKIARDMARSPLSDANAILKSGGKFFIAPTQLTPIESSPLIPHFSSPSVKDSIIRMPECFKDRVSLLTICFSAYSEPHLDSFKKPFMEEFSGKVDLVEVRPIMTRIKWVLFNKLVKRVVLQGLPDWNLEKFIVTYQPMELIDTLQIPNFMGSFIYLIDGEGRVRWSACGMASPDELESLSKLTRQLLTKSRKNLP